MGLDSKSRATFVLLCETVSLHLIIQKVINRNCCNCTKLFVTYIIRAIRIFQDSYIFCSSNEDSLFAEIVCFKLWLWRHREKEVNNSLIVIFTVFASIISCTAFNSTLLPQKNSGSVNSRHLQYQHRHDITLLPCELAECATM